MDCRSWLSALCTSLSWSSSSSSLLSFFASSKLSWVIAVPLVVLSGFVIIKNPRSSHWGMSLSKNSWPFASSDASLEPVTANVSVAPSSFTSLLDEHSLPPLAKGDQQTVANGEDSSRVTRNAPWNVSFQNESNWIPSAVGSQQKLSNLQRLEGGLARSRAAIRRAQNGNQTLDDPDYVPRGPMYWNANAFHRSYLEMEKQFKIYVYEDGEPPVFHVSSSSGILGMEGIIIDQIETSRFRTRNPEKAHVYFLPFSVLSIVSYVYVVDSRAWGPMKNTALDYVNVIAEKYHYWNRSLGSDHFMLACHDWAPEISSAIPYLYRNSIRVLCNANTSERFNPAKDVSMPEIYLPKGTIDGLIGGPSPSKRSILVFYAGGIHGYIRSVLMEHWENKDDDVQIHQYLPKNVSYYGMIRKSKFCICPSGYEVASPRMVEALYMGCVPVLIKDHYVAPFSDVLNWKTFSVDVSVKDIPNLKKILMGISSKQYIKMQRRGIQVRRHFEVNFPPKRYDVFHMILHSIWLRRLNIKVRDVM